MYRAWFMGRWRSFLWGGLVLLMSFPLWAEPEPAPASAYSAAALRAAYFFNFAKFTEWPTHSEILADSPILLGVIDDAEMETALWKLTSGQKIGGRPVRVKRVLDGADASVCHVLYLGSSLSTARREWMKEVGTRPVLTVSSSPTFLQEGGIIRFFTEGQNLRFEIDAAAAQKAGLVLSSRLLALSRSGPSPTRSP